MEIPIWEGASASSFFALYGFRNRVLNLLRWAVRKGAAGFVVDWNEIRKEYIQGGVSYRELAAKYGVSLRTLADRAKDEKWVQLREQARNKTVTKTVEAVSSQNADVGSSVNEAAMELLEAFRSTVKKEKTMTAARLKDYGAALKSIQAVLSSGPTELDIQEQEARIANLRRQAEKDEDADGVVVTLEGGLEDYAV